MFIQGRLCLRAVGGSPSRLTALPVRTTYETQTPTYRLRGVAAPSLSVVQLRNFHSVKFTSKLEYYSSTNVSLPKKISELPHALEGHDRPLTLLLTWLMAKDKHIHKYVKFYNDMGIDVLACKFSPLDIMSPKFHAKGVVNQFLNFLHHYPPNSPLLVHGFSVGGYLCAAALVDIENDMETHGHLLDRFKGQIWDSVVDVSGLPIGVSKAVTNCGPLQRTIHKTLDWFMRYRYHTATIYYDRASVVFHKNFMATPGLFLVSNNDPIAPPEMVLKAYDNWKELGYPVYAKVWDDSIHVTHYRSHPKEYEEQVKSFIKNIGLKVPLRPSVVPYGGKLNPFQESKSQHPAPILT